MKRLVSYAIAGALVLGATNASAYCRTMACSGGDCPHDERGCPTSGAVAVWAQPMPLTFRFHRRGTALLINEEARAAVRAAFLRWTDVVCAGGRTSLRFVEGEDLLEDKPLTDDAHAPRSTSPFGVYFRDTGWPHAAQNGDGVLALTTLDVGVETGRITYADIEINTGSQPLTTSELVAGQDLQTVMTHEVGHYIGLAHSAVANSIMNPGLCDSGQRCQVDKVAARRLGDDDLAAVCGLYPPGARAPVVSPSEDGASEGCASSRVPTHYRATNAFAALALLLAVRRVRTARRAGAQRGPDSTSTETTALR